jgi:hypothetical protein
VRARLGEAGICVVQTPYQGSNANAYAEPFVSSIKHECLNRVIPFGERHLRRTIIAESSSTTTVSAITKALITN